MKNANRQLNENKNKLNAISIVIVCVINPYSWYGMTLELCNVLGASTNYTGLRSLQSASHQPDISDMGYEEKLSHSIVA